VSNPAKTAANPEAAALAEPKLGTDADSNSFSVTATSSDRRPDRPAERRQHRCEYILGTLVATKHCAVRRYCCLRAPGSIHRRLLWQLLAWVNFLGFALQAGASPPILYAASAVRSSAARISLPAMRAGRRPILGVVRLVKNSRNSTDYSHQTPSSKPFGCPPRASQYKARRRSTRFSCASAMFISGHRRAGSALGAGVRLFALFNVLLTAGWLWVAWQIKIEHRRRTV